MERTAVLATACLVLLAQQAGAQTNEKAQINSYLRGLKYDPRVVLAVQGEGFTSVAKGGGKDLGTKVDDSDAQQTLVVTTLKQYNLKRNFEEVSILQPTRGVVFPGSLLQANDELVNGRPQRISAFEGKGAFARLSIDLPGLQAKGRLVVQNPTDSAVRAVIDERVAWWLDNKTKEGFSHSARQSYSMTMAYSNEQVALELGLTASSAQGSVSAEMKIDAKSEKKIAIAIYKQVFYTVSCDAPTSPADLLADSAKLADVQSIMTPQSPPAFVQSVNFGRILMLRVESDKSVTEADLNAMLSYAKGDKKLDVKAKAKYAKVLESCSVSVITLGGNSKTASKLVTARDPDALAEIIQQNSELTKDNPGEPISYTVQFLKDNRLAKMGYSTDYTVPESKEYVTGFVKLVHDGGYVANFKLSWQEYTKVGERWEWQDKSQAWRGANYRDTKTFNLKPGVRNVQVSGEAAILINTWREIFTHTFATAPVATIRVFGTTLNRKFEIK